MKSLIKLYLIIIGAFALIFALVNLTGILSAADIKNYLEQIQHADKYKIALIVSALLASDVFLSVPTILIVTYAGNILGFELGLAASTVGMLISGSIAYILCRLSGNKMLTLLIKDKEKIDEVNSIFHRMGFSMLIIARALPMLPEATCCLSGMMRFNFIKFLTYYLLGTLPYAIVLTYLGSISSLDNPYPALIGIGVVYAILYLLWYFKLRHTKN
ncbi:MAG TPA: DedA family protein [Flavobacteriales bacterium]|nr:DedA family protein [Flavobacteriales bacterium]